MIKKSRNVARLARANEAFRVRNLEGGGIVEARVPSLGGRPVDQNTQLLQ